MNVSVVSQEAFFVCMVEVCAMVDSSLLAGSATKDFGPPGISDNDISQTMVRSECNTRRRDRQVAIKVDDTDWTVCLGNAAE